MDEMKKLVEYFEGAPEAVYISDADTQEPIYMNPSLQRGLKESGQAGCLDGDYEAQARAYASLRPQLAIREQFMNSGGRRYRIEVGQERSRLSPEQETCSFTSGERVLNECLQIFSLAPDPERALNGLLHYLGEVFHSHRAYIFEIYEDGTTTNTYEWNAEGVPPQIALLHSILLPDISYWIEMFSTGDSVVIQNLEELHQRQPNIYSLLKPQGIVSLVAGPIRENGRLKGFIGVDNPDEENLFLLEQLLKELGKYMMLQLKRRDIYRRFNHMSYHDMLTGSYNYNAMLEHSAASSQWKSFGAVCCDIHGLRETNHVMGHDAGNELVQECYRLIQQRLHTEWIYRVDGNKFVAFYHDTDQETIDREADALRLSVLQSTCQMSIGSIWSDEKPIDMKKILDQADTKMRRERKLYQKLAQMDAPDRRPDGEAELCQGHMDNEGGRQMLLRRFLSNTYCDMAFLLSVLSYENKIGYFFFGDMQQNIYYISENMRVKFGFSKNIVSDLIHVWASRIEDPNLLQRFWQDMDGLMQNRQKYHNLRYQVLDVNGNRLWVHSHGQIKWSQDGTTPLFFVGRIFQQDEDFVVDPLTNFPTEAALVKELEKNLDTREHDRAIGFALHNITQINNNYGRDYGDNLICEITRKLSDMLSHEMKFFRLSGMRFLGLVEGHSADKAEEQIAKIRTTIDHIYHKMGVMLPSTCSFVLLRCIPDGVTPQDFIENMLSLIKLAQQTPDQMLIHDSSGSLQKIKQMAMMEQQLMEDVLQGMKNFRIVIQPVVSTETGCPVGGETLLRWKYNDGQVSPGVFIPIIERENMIHLVGRWVFEQAVRACVRLTALVQDFYLTVNVSLQQLDDEGFTAFILQILGKYELDGRHIVLELTESCIDSQPEKLDAFVQECTRMNIRIALDDFGSGYSSLRVLLRYPSNIIKLDRSLLIEMSDSSEKSSFITSVVYACHQFGKKVCMEGVETELQRNLVKKAGCDLIQGFYYYRPLELDAAYQLAGLISSKKVAPEVRTS